MKCPRCQALLLEETGYWNCADCGSAYNSSYFTNREDQKLNQQEVNQMATIGKNAQDYVPPQTLNISELESVSVNIELEEKSGIKKEDGKEFHYNVIVVDEKEYRVPNSVLKNLKAIMEEKPDLKNFKVKKTGEGYNTEYTVIEL